MPLTRAAYYWEIRVSLLDSDSDSAPNSEGIRFNVRTVLSGRLAEQQGDLPAIRLDAFASTRSAAIAGWSASPASCSSGCKSFR